MPPAPIACSLSDAHLINENAEIPWLEIEHRRQQCDACNRFIGRDLSTASAVDRIVPPTHHPTTLTFVATRDRMRDADRLIAPPT